MTESEAVRTVVGSVALGAQSIINTFLGFVFFIFLARMISQAEMGVYASFLLVMFLFETIGPLGLSTAAVRFVPRSLGEGRNDQVSRYVTSILVVSFLSAIAFSSGLYFLASPFSLLLTKSASSSGVFGLASVAVFFNIPAANLDAVMQGLQSFGKLAAVRVFAQALRVGVSIALLVMGYALVGVVFGFIAMNACSLLVLLYFVRSHLRVRPQARVTADLLEYSFPILLSNLANFLSSQADLLVLMTFTIPAIVGTYEVAVTVGGLLGTILIATAYATVQPVAAKLFGSFGEQGLESALKRASRYLVFVFVPAAVGLAALGGTAMGLMAGERYLEAVVPLGVISVASIAWALSIIPIMGLQTVGSTGSVLGITIFSSVIGVVVDVALIPGLGGLGAALGRAAFMLAVLALAAYIARRRVNLRFDLEALRASMLASVAMGIVLVLVQARLGFAPYNVLLYIPVGIIVFLVGMRFQRALRCEDIDLLLKVLPPRFKWISELVSWVATQ
jgi:O-antigen/teichoic acid export membrane protein